MERNEQRLLKALLTKKEWHVLLKIVSSLELVIQAELATTEKFSRMRWLQGYKQGLGDFVGAVRTASQEESELEVSDNE